MIKPSTCGYLHLPVSGNAPRGKGCGSDGGDFIIHARSWNKIMLPSSPFVYSQEYRDTCNLTERTPRLD